MCASRLLLALALQLAACGSTPAANEDPCHPDPGTYVIEIVVDYPADVGLQGVEAAWSDRSDAVVRGDGTQGSGTLILRRAFATRAESLAFSGSFVARVAGADVGLAFPQTVACEAVATTVGLAPGALHLFHRGYGIVQGVAADGAATLALEAYETTTCATEPRSRAPDVQGCLRDQRTMHFHLVAPAGLTVTVDAATHPLAAITSSPNRLVYEVEVAFPTAAAVAAQSAELGFTIAGADAGHVSADFSRCISLFALGPYAPESLRYQDEGLSLDATGRVFEDELLGILCTGTEGGLAGTP